MQFGNISQNKELEQSLPAVLHKALEYLRTCNFDTIEDGKHIINGENIFMNVMRYETTPREQRKAECHQRYIDVQFLISGQEMIGVGLEQTTNELLQVYSSDSDAALYGRVQDEKYYSLEQGSYLILMPGEIHRPGCSIADSSKVRKAVIKIDQKLLSSQDFTFMISRN